MTLRGSYYGREAFTHKVGKGAFFVPDPILVGQAIATVYLMYRQNHHLAEANRIAREKKGARVAIAKGWPQTFRHYWPLIAMGVLAVASWIPFFLGPRSTPELFLQYGWNGSRIFAVINTAELTDKRPQRLMTISRIEDNAVDYKTDTRIARSATFEILSISTDVEVTPPADFFVRPGQVDIYLLLVPKDFPIELIRNLADAEKLGGKIIASHGFAGVATVQHP